jgi:PAS domain S-box-containing protein/excisionase family DNA binding protein
MTTGHWLTVQDVAERLQVRIETVRLWIRRGELPVLELGGSRTVYRVRMADLERFILEHYGTQVSEPIETPSIDVDAETADIGGTLTDGDETSDSVFSEAADYGIGLSEFGIDSIEKSREFVDHLPVVTFREDLENPGSPSFMSREIESILGISADDFPYAPGAWLEYVHPLDRHVVIEELARTDQSGEPFQMEYRMIRRDGDVVWIRIDAELDSEEPGPGSAWVGTIRNITERKRLEAALGLRQIQQRAIADLGREALAADSLSVLFAHAVSRVTQALDVEFTKIFELSPGTGTLMYRAGIGWVAGRAGEVSVPFGEDEPAGVTARVDPLSEFTLSSNMPVAIENLATETRFDGQDMVTSFGVNSGASVLIAGRGRPYGVLVALSVRRRIFSQEDGHFLQAVSHVVSSAISRSHVNWYTVTDVAELLQVTEETVRRWIRRMELPAMNLGGPRAGYRVYPSDLERFIQERLSSL